ncbi:hypothetical protein BJY00DRAFT_66196 [Aspergillus carlsbadensis]|nr:hypothetical protein BJY00DRAFT_66196 [Aspergillus carlsbadensis]
MTNAYATAPGDGDLEALRVTQPLLPNHYQVEDYDSHSWVLLEDHPLRSHPTELECHPEILSFSRKCFAGLRRGWRERVLPLLCLALMFFVVVQFLLQLPRLASHFLEPVAIEEVPGFIQLSSTLGDPTGFESSESVACVYRAPPPLMGGETYDAVENALTSGRTSVKVDLWLRNHDLLVGSDPKGLDKERTLQTIYLQPLQTKLDALNLPFSSTSGATDKDKSDSYEISPIGLFEENPTQSLALVLDIRTPARTTWPQLFAQLRTLNESGYLSYRDNATQGLVVRPVTLVLAENECQRPPWIERLSRIMRGS